MWNPVGLKGLGTLFSLHLSGAQDFHPCTLYNCLAVGWGSSFVKLLVAFPNGVC